MRILIQARIYIHTTLINKGLFQVKLFIVEAVNGSSLQY